MKTFEELRTLLLHKKDVLEGRISEIDEDIRHVNGPLDPIPDEQAIERENDEVLSALSDIEHRELEQINVALMRMDRNEYGNCAVCSEKIPEERLEALPYCDCCVNCAELRDRSHR